MLIVPLEKDKITTKDKQVLRVVEYTNFKEGGPAVYCRSKSSTENVLVYFFDIEEINGVRVEYVKGSKIFNALGKLTRSIHLPQPDDEIMVPDKGAARSGTRKTVTVASLKLKSKTHGHNRGMLVKDTDGNVHRLRDVSGIDRSMGTSIFNREEFSKMYFDYMGV